MIPNAIMLRVDLSCGAKIVYGYLKHLAWRDASEEVVTTREVIQRDLGIGKNQVTAYIQELTLEPAEEGDLEDDSPRLVEARRQGRGLPNIYVINDPVMSPNEPEVIPSIRESRKPESGLLENPNEGFSLCTQETKYKKQATPSISPPQRESEKGKHPAVIVTRKNRSVDRKPVTAEEDLLARDVLLCWNELASQSLSSQDWINKIILRIREHSELTLADHSFVIEQNLGDPWWKGPANPSVVYGSGAQFERSMIKASSAERNGSQGAFEIALAELKRMEESRV
jgi:hypothetical protein